MTRTALIVILVCLVTASPATAQAPAATADSAWAAGNFVRAESLYHTLATHDTTQVAAWYRLALAAESNHHDTTAADAMRHAISLGVRDPLAQYRLARLEARLGHRDSAIRILDGAVGHAAVPSGTALEAMPEFAFLKLPQHRALVRRADSLAHPCESSVDAHQFDFWIGDWDVTPWGSAATPASAGHGHNDVHPILAHCAISENWTSAIGAEGKSSNWFDTNIHKWRQAWMADGGGPLDYTGEYRDGAMRFEGWTRARDGSRLLQKLTFFNIAPDTVRQLFEQSADNGKTWQPTFDGRYVRIKPKR